MMTEQKIYFTEQVLLMNKDISDLFEQRGVSCADVREIFRLAAWMVAEQSGISLKLYLPPDPCPRCGREKSECDCCGEPDCEICV
jgi:hypothetical protein